MDVRCERCKTEYEFDDARITEAGVTVKCTTCEHVFRVKKKALVVTVPVKPGEVDPASVPPPPAPGSSAANVPAGPPREWRLRQPAGNILTFKELTTLQKWIVERKAFREDQISLTGETWKRLGEIAELDAFFQIVDQAMRVNELEERLAQQAAQPAFDPLPVPAPVPAPSVPAARVAASRAETPAPSPELAPVHVPVPAQGLGMPAISPAQDRHAVRSAQRRGPEVDQEDVDLAAAGLQKRSGAGKWIGAFVFLGAVGAAGWYGYQHHGSSLMGRRASEVKGPVAIAVPAELPPALALEPEAPAETAEAAAPVAAAEPTPAPAPAPEPTPEHTAVATPVPAEEPPETEEPEKKVEVVTASTTAPAPSFDGLMRQADRLRLRDRAAQALATYEKASALKPDRAEPVAGRGLALFDLGRNDEAETAFREALRLNPRYAVAVMGLAETYRHQGKTSEALEQYRRYLEILPNGREAPVAKAAIKRLEE